MARFLVAVYFSIFLLYIIIIEVSRLLFFFFFFIKFKYFTNWGNMEGLILIYFIYIYNF